MANEREFLEKLIFEVHGAEKAKTEIQKLVDQEEKYKTSLKGLKKEAKERAKAETQAAEEIAQAEAKKREARAATLKSAGVGVAALAALAAKAFSELERADGRLERSARKAGASQADLARTMAEVDDKARKLGLGLVDQREAMSKLIDATGDLHTAQQDLALINDIVATGDADLKGAIELVTKARKGEIEELKRLDGLNKQAIENLSYIDDYSRRGAEAINLLKTEYAGAADELRGTADAWENLKQAGEDLLAVVGDAGNGLINGIAQLLGVVGPGQGLFDQFATGMRNFSGAAREASSYLKDWIDYKVSLGLTGVSTPEGFAQFLSDRDSQRAMTAASGAPSGAPAPRGGGSSAGSSPILRYGPSVPEGFGKKPKGTRDPNRGSDALTGAGAPTDAEVWGAIWEEAYGRDIEAHRAAQEAKRAEYNETLRVEAEGREYLADIEAKTEAMRADLEAKRVTAQQKTQDALWAGAEAAAGLAGGFIKDEGAKAVIQGGMETARAIAAGAAGNIPGAIGHGAAAAQFFAVAAQAGQGGKKGKGGGGRGGSSPALSSDRERVSLMNEQNKSRESRASQTHVVNIYSTFGPSPQQSRELVDAVEREMRNRTTTRRM